MDNFQANEEKKVGQQQIVVGNQNQVAQENQQQFMRNVFDEHLKGYEGILNDHHRKNNNDSEEMQRVKNSLTLVTNVLKTKLDPDGAAFGQQLENLRSNYNALIEACDHYLDTKWLAKLYLFGEAKRRRKLVIAIKDMAQREIDCLSGISKDKNLHDKHLNGELIGDALSDTLRDYQAAKKKVTNINGYEEENGVYTGTWRDSKTDVFHEVIVNKEACKISDGMKNAICATKFAEFIGMDGVCRRTMLILHEDKQKKNHYGIRNEGIPANNLSLDEIKQTMGQRPYKISYTAEALKQISNARIFNLLMGGKTLNPEKDIIMIHSISQLDGERVYHVTGAYLDVDYSSFSKENNVDTIKKLLAKDDFFMDADMAETILNIDAKDLDYIGGDFLSKDQKKAFADRVTYLKTWVQTTKDKEAQSGSSTIVPEEAWKDKDSIAIIKGSISETGNGFYKGILKANTYIEETDGDKQHGLLLEYNKFYNKLKKSIDSCTDMRERVLIIAGILESNVYFKEKYPDNQEAAGIAPDLQSRLLSEYANEDFIKALHEERFNLKSALAEAYEAQANYVMDDTNVGISVISENRTIYKNLTLLNNLNTLFIGANALGRDLRHNKMNAFSHDIGQDLLEEKGAQKAKTQKDSAKADEIMAEIEKEENKTLKQEIDGQIASWTKNYFMKNPKASLTKNIPELTPEYIKNTASKEIINYYEALSNIKAFVIPQRPEFKGDPNDEKAVKAHKKAELAFKDEITKVGLLITAYFGNLRTAIKSFLRKQKPENRDKRLEELFGRITMEKRMFTNMVSEYLAGNKTYSKSTTWNDIINKGSNVSYEIGKAKNIGGGTSEVYRLKGKTTKYVYFKPEDKLEINETETFKSLLDKEADIAANSKDLTEDEKETVGNFLQTLYDNMKEDYEAEIKDKKKNEQMKELLYNIYTSAWDYVPTKDIHLNTSKFYRILVDGNKKNDRKFESIFKSILSVGAPQFFNVFGFLQNNPEKLDEKLLKYLKDMTVRIMTNFTFKLNQFVIATKTAKMKPGATVTTRNVGTTRIADAIGIGHMVARSENVVVKKDGNELFGNVMEEAKGKKIKKFGEKTKYSLKGILDINTMVIFDMLEGQVDRHEENVYYETHMENGVEIVDGVQLIDNDMCGGTLKIEDYDNKKAGVAMPFDVGVLESVPNQVLRNIQNLDMNTVKLLKEDILSEKELEAWGKRLEFIKGKINAYFKKVEAFKKAKDRKSRILGKVYENDEYKALMFAKYIYQKSANEVIEADDKRFRSISIDGLPPIEEIDAKIKEVRTKISKELDEEMKK